MSAARSLTVVALLLAASRLAAQTPVFGPNQGSSAPGASAFADLTDIGCATVASSSTPTFNAAADNCFEMTLTGDVTSSTLTGEIPGQTILLRLTQDDPPGGHSFAYPPEVAGGCAIAQSAGATTEVLLFVSSGGVAVQACRVPDGPDAWTFECVDPAAVEAPPAGHRTDFCDSTNSDHRSVKTSADGVVDLESGAGGGGGNITLFDFGFGNAASAGGTFNSTTGNTCYLGGATTASSGGLLAGGPNITGGAADDVLCRAPVIQTGVNLTNVTITATFGENTNEPGSWVVKFQGQCLSSGAIGAWNDMASFTIAGDASTTARVIVVSQTGINISGFCASGQALYVRVIEDEANVAETATSDLILTYTQGYAPAL